MLILPRVISHEAAHVRDTYVFAGIAVTTYVVLYDGTEQAKQDQHDEEHKQYAPHHCEVPLKIKQLIYTVKSLQRNGH